MTRLEWDEYYMANAFLAAQRSKDPVTKVGACIVNQEKKIVGIGYNGFPIGCCDSEYPWTKGSSDPLESKYMYVCHAEMNAILNKNSSNLNGCQIYVSLFPCNGCTKMIIQSRIKKVIYYSDKYADKPSTIASKKLLDAAGVEYVKFMSSSCKGPIHLNVFDIHCINQLELKEQTDSFTSNFLCWTDYFMASAILASYRSRNNDKRLGACIINSENKIVGIGYDGLPIDCNLEDFYCSTESEKEMYSCHAEMNAIVNKNCDNVKNCTMYVVMFPCSECAKMIIQSGIRKICYLRVENFASIDAQAASRMFSSAGVDCLQYEMVTSKIVIDFDAVNK